MIVSGGVNIYPAETEQVLIQHPGVGDVAVIGAPNAEMGEEVKALIVPKDAGQPADGRGSQRLLPRAAGRLQMPALLRDRGRHRPQRHGQDQQARTPPKILAVGPNHRRLNDNTGGLDG